MTRRHPTRLLLCIAALAACGTSDSGGDAGLSIRARWQASGSLGPECLGQELPKAARGIRVTIRSADGRYQCCLGLNPDDPTLADRSAVLTGLPIGQVTVGFDAYPQPQVPSDGIATTCRLREGRGAPCVDDPCVWPSYTADAATATLAEGKESRVEMCARARPFLVPNTAHPPCNDVVDAYPVPVALVVADVDGQVGDRASVRIGQTDEGPPQPGCAAAPPTKPSLSEVIRTRSCVCRDPDASGEACGGDGEPPCCVLETGNPIVPAPCSPGGALGVAGRVWSGAAYTLHAGCAYVELATDAGVGFVYPFRLGSNPPTPTPSATRVPTETPTATPTATVRFTASPPATPTATASATEPIIG